MIDYTELVKALRCRDAEFGYYRKCKYYGEASDNRCVLCDSDRLAKDAAAAIEELQAEVKRLEPKQRKLGRWGKAKPKGVVVYSDGYAECSSCHETIWLGWGMNFCPHCGVQNRIIDPDDIAKMEVQE